KLRRSIQRLEDGLIFWFNEDLEVRLVTFPDFFHKERVHVARRRDQRDIGVAALLRRFYVAEILRSLDHPKIFIAGDEIKDLIVLRQNDQGCVTQLGLNKNDVLSCIFDGAGLTALSGSRDRRQDREKDDSNCFSHDELLARISKPFSNPCSRNACSRRKLSFGSLV